MVWSCERRALKEDALSRIAHRALIVNSACMPSWRHEYELSTGCG